MATDANTGQPIFSHHASLHSRNRRPFALSDNRPVSGKQTATTVTPVAVGALNDDLNDATLPENGYATGNARFLHIQIENNGTDDGLALYAYNYAFGSWAKLYIPVGVGLDGSGDDASTTNDAYVAAEWTTISGKFMVTVPIQGIDRVGFCYTGDDLDDMVVRAACSTF